MFAKTTCPVCGHNVTVAEGNLGQRLKCPNCQSPFVASAPEVRPVPAPAAINPVPSITPELSKTLLAPVEEPIRFNCPRCGKSLESPGNMGGQKLNCPSCGQRLQIPQPSAPPVPLLNKTLLAAETPATPLPPMVRPVPPPLPSPSKGRLAGEAIASSSKNCLECGRDISNREQVLTCPNCGSLFCSSACYRDHQHYSHSGRQHRIPPPFPRTPMEVPKTESGLALAYTILTVLGSVAAIAGITMILNSSYVVEFGHFERDGFDGNRWVPPRFGTHYGMQGTGIFLCVLSGGSLLLAFIFFFIWLYQAWAVVPPEYGGPEPGMAVGLLFVPLFNLYWIFRVIPGLSQALKDTLRKRGQVSDAGFGVGLAACILSFIPYVNVIAVILFLVWINMANGAKNRLILLQNSRGVSGSQEI